VPWTALIEPEQRVFKTRAEAESFMSGIALVFDDARGDLSYE
jgi:hypothetical protein